MTGGPGRFLAVIAVRLEALAIPYMVVGSFASSTYGPPRTTQDLDIVVDPTPAQLDAFLAGLDPDELYVDAEVARAELRRRGMFNVIDVDGGWKLDLIVRKPRPFSLAELARRQPVTMFGVAVWAATAEDTVIAKLEWAKQGGSERQLDDVRGILLVQGDTLDVAYIEHWVGELGLEDGWERVRSRSD